MLRPDPVTTQVQDQTQTQTHGQAQTEAQGQTEAQTEGQGQGQGQRPNLPGDVSASHSSSSSGSSSGICNDVCVGKGLSNTVSVSQNQSSSSSFSSSSLSSSSSSFAIPTIVPRRRKVVNITGLDGKALGKSDEGIVSIRNEKGSSSDKLYTPKSGVSKDDYDRNEDKENSKVNNRREEKSPKDNASHSSLTGLRSYTYSGRSVQSVRTEGCRNDDGDGKSKREEAETEKGEGCRLLASDLHLIVMTHTEVSTLMM